MDLQPDELDTLRGPLLVRVCLVCDEPTDETCAICDGSVCIVCQPEHERGDSCEVNLD